jgi:hypothetical protein
MGVGPEQNFQYIAGLKPKIAFIIDIRRQNMIQHLMYKAAFEMSENRADFLSVIFSRKRPEGLTETSTPEQLFAAYREAPKDDALAETTRQAIKELLIRKHGFKLTEDDGLTIDHVFDVFAAYGVTLNYSSNVDGLGRATPGRVGPNNVEYAELMIADDNGVNRSYLASEDSFRFVKEMEAKNLLIPIVGNFGGPKAIRAVGRYLKEHDAIVSAFYLSNVEQYLFRPPQGGTAPIHAQFYQNVETLPLDASSTFIRSGNRQPGARGGLTPMMSPIMEILNEFKLDRINSQADVINRSTN